MRIKVMVAALPVIALAIAGCAGGGAAKAHEEQERADGYRIATDRGFTPISFTRASMVDTSAYVGVTFGHCVGKLQVDDGAIKLIFNHVVAGASSNTDPEVVTLDDPKVTTMKADPAFKVCFPDEH